MGILIDRELCEDCGECVPHCSHHALKMDGGVLKVDNSLCVDCAICTDYCPNEALDLTDNVVGEFLVQDESPADAYPMAPTERKRVRMDPDNPCVMRLDGCTECGGCVKTCVARVHKLADPDCDICLGCGQCIQTCPEHVLRPRDHVSRVLEELSGDKVCVAFTAPGTRVALGDSFGGQPGQNVEGKLVSALRNMGFDYVLDLNFGADVTVMEEASELVSALRQPGSHPLPLITSCCPAWVRYCELFYPDILDHVSSCKSPMGMEGALIDAYFAPHNGIDPERLYTVAIAPCTAKKGEITQPEITGTDAVITIRELSDYISKNMDYESLPEGRFDQFMGTGSGAGAIFANTGGVMEAALRTANYLLTGEELADGACSALHGLDDFKEQTLSLGGNDVHVAVINGMSNAIAVLDSIREGTCKYDFVEIMNCWGGCVGGGGQPPLSEEDEFYVKRRRVNALYEKDSKLACRSAHNNPEVKRLYDDFLGEPLGSRAKELLHRSYVDRSDEVAQRKG